VIQAFYPGMEGGTAIAEALFGDINPSGKLPCTYPHKLSDSPAHALNAYPGQNGIEEYKEGLLVGYRWYDAKNIDPLFEFGHGLSYTQFAYSGLKLSSADPLTVQCDIANTGSRDGAEVVQLYVSQGHPSLPRPPKELKGFKKIFLRAGEKQTVTIPLKIDAFSYYDPAKGAWIAEKGTYTILVGASSRDIRQQGDFNLPQTRITADDK
jgi:beta-glucosidase